jgi:putative ABC transport system substrate-binding protein
MRDRKKSLWCLGVTLGMLCIFPHMQAEAQGIAAIKSQNNEPFKQALDGFVDACNNHVTEYDLPRHKGRARKIIKDVMAKKPKLILAIGTRAAQVVKQGVRNIPVVFFMVPNPHKYGLGGGNMVGISLDIPVKTQFATYKMLVPTLQVIGVIYDPKKTGALVKEAERVGKPLGLQLVAAPVASHKGVPAALRSLLGKIDALWMVPDDTVVTLESFKFMTTETIANHLPFLAVADIFVERGAFASLSPDYPDQGRQACQLGKQIQNGQLLPGKATVLPPEKINCAINSKTASNIHLTLPKKIPDCEVYQ